MLYLPSPCLPPLCALALLPGWGSFLPSYLEDEEEDEAKSGGRGEDGGGCLGLGVGAPGSRMMGAEGGGRAGQTPPFLPLRSRLRTTFLNPSSLFEGLPSFLFLNLKTSFLCAGGGLRRRGLRAGGSRPRSAGGRAALAAGAPICSSMVEVLMTNDKGSAPALKRRADLHKCPDCGFLAILGTDPCVYCYPSTVAAEPQTEAAATAEPLDIGPLFGGRA